MKKSVKFRNNNKGMTLVEVLMGFVLLLLLMGMVSGIISASTKIYNSSVDLTRAQEAIQKVIYSNEIDKKTEKQTTSLKLIPSEAMEDQTEISFSADLYKLSGKDVIEETDSEDDLEVDVYFLREPEQTEE